MTVVCLVLFLCTSELPAQSSSGSGAAGGSSTGPPSETEQECVQFTKTKFRLFGPETVRDVTPLGDLEDAFTSLYEQTEQNFTEEFIPWIEATSQECPLDLCDEQRLFQMNPSPG